MQRYFRLIVDEALTSPSPGVGMDLLLRSGAFGALLPEVASLEKLGEDPISALHKDVWDHTKLVVAGVPARVELRWAAMLHDIGKVRTRRVTKGGRVTFHGHDVVGARMVDDIQRRMKLFDEALLSTIRTLVLNHLRPAGYKKDWSDSGVRRLITDLGGPAGLSDLLLLARADLTTKNPAKRARALANSAALEARAAAIFAEDSAPKLPKGTIGIIIERSGRSAGPWAQQARDQLEARLRDGTLPLGQPPEFYVAAWLGETTAEGEENSCDAP